MRNVFEKCLFDVKMYSRDLGQKIFLENVYDDVVKTFIKHFASYIKMFGECFVNIIAVSRNLTDFALNVVINSYHYDYLLFNG